MRALADLVARWRTPEPEFPHSLSEPEVCVLCNTATSRMKNFKLHGICENCDYHHSISAWTRIKLLADPGSFHETNASTTSIDPLSFPDGGNYRRQLREAFRRTALREAAVTGRCEIRGRPVMLIVLDFGFLGGSMGVVVGERVAQAFENATKHNLPVVSVISSSGMRMREGLLALQQMAKTAATANDHSKNNLGHFTILANPCTGSVFASFANLADVIIGEPGALMGYTSLAVLEKTDGKPLAPEHHSSESHLKLGLIDQIVTRTRQRDFLASLIDLTAPSYRLEITKPIELITRRPNREFSPWHEVSIARHTDRPTALDYISRISTSFIEIHGDRIVGDDPGILTGFADLGGQAVMFVGHQRSVNDGNAPPYIHPYGIRKATRAVRIAEKFSLPIITFIDTRGAIRNRVAEDGGIGNAIAKHLATMTELKTPILSMIIGEGGSAAALSLSIADRVLISEHAIFSISSPEDTASALFRNTERADEAAKALKLTATDAFDLGIVNRIISEPEGGAHTDHDAAATLVKAALIQELAMLRRIKIHKLTRARYTKYRKTSGYQNFFRVSLGRNITDLQSWLRRRWTSKRLSTPPEIDHDDVDDIPIN